MTKNMFFLTILALALTGATAVVQAEELVAQFSGNHDENTAEFDVDAPWIVDWLISGEPGQYEAVSISLINADTGAYEGSVLKAKSAGNGVLKFDQSGSFYFRVDASMMDWSLKVIKLTDEEAKQYKPASEPPEMNQ